MPAPIATVLLPTVLHPLATDLPPGLDVSEVLEDLSADGVSAPANEVDGLVDVVERANEHGFKLGIVVLDKNPGHDLQLRDLATELGGDTGGTILVMSPNWVGTYSDGFSRVQLDAGQDHSYTGNAVMSANNFVDELIDPGPPWALMTTVLVAVVVVVAALSSLAKFRRSRNQGIATGSSVDVTSEADGSDPVASPKST